MKEVPMKKFLLTFCAILLFALPASAKDTAGLWGVGFTKALSPADSSLTSISVRYWLDKQLGLEGLFGYNLINRDEDDERAFNLGGRFLVKVVEEQNLHVYGGAGLALLYNKNDSKGEDGKAGLGVDAFAGVEYFFQGLPNLGFSSEVGVGLASSGGTTAFGTNGGSFLDFGIRYYF
jgi:hypothetical protein